MALPKTENFSSLAASANLTGISGWLVPAGAFKASNTGADITPNNSAAISMAYWSSDTFNADQYAQIKVVQSTSTDFIGPALHVQVTTGYGYYCLIAPGNGGAPSDSLGYIGYYNGSANDLRQFTCPAAGTVLRLESTGTTFTLKGNGSIIQTQPIGGGTATDTFTDSTYSGGYAGISAYGNSNTTIADDWEGGNLGGGGGGGPAIMGRRVYILP